MSSSSTMGFLQVLPQIKNLHIRLSINFKWSLAVGEIANGFCTCLCDGLVTCRGTRLSHSDCWRDTSSLLPGKKWTKKMDGCILIKSSAFFLQDNSLVLNSTKLYVFWQKASSPQAKTQPFTSILRIKDTPLRTVMFNFRTEKTSS